MLRQTTQKITALYPRLSHEDELQGESKLCFLSTHQRKAVLYAVFDPHYFSSEPSQDPYQPLHLKDGDC